MDDLVLKSNGFGNLKRVSLDVNYNGADYIISNVLDTNGTNDSNTTSYEEQCLCYSVTENLIENDRIQSEVDALDHSKELRVEQAIKALEIYGGYLFPYRFECHWYTGLITREQTYDGYWFIKVNVTITNQYGAERKAIAQAYINNVTEAVEDFAVH